MVDAPHSKCGEETRVGSSPTLGTKKLYKVIILNKKLIIAVFLFAILLFSCAATVPSAEIVRVNFSDNPALSSPSEPIIFSPNITFLHTYKRDNQYMPYALFIPSTAVQSQPLPLIVWLHGSGEVDSSETRFLDSGFQKMLQNWKTEGFSAYVLFPHLSGNVDFERWDNQDCLEKLKELIDFIVESYNINPDNIIIAGASLGAFGAEYMACNLPGYFTRLMVISSFESRTNPSRIQIPAIGFVGQAKYGEDKYSEKYMLGKFAKVFGRENVFVLEASHNKILEATFLLDKDENGRSDAIEWMLGISK